MIQLRITQESAAGQSGFWVSFAPASAARARRWLKWSGIVYATAALIYMIDSGVTQSGLLGYVEAMELEAVGVAPDWLTWCIGFVLLVLPLGAIEKAMEKLPPPAVSLAVKPQLPNAPFPGSWKQVFRITSIPLLATAAASLLFLILGQLDLREKVYQLKLDDPAARLPRDAKFIQVTGLVARQYVVGYDNVLHPTGGPDIITQHVFAPVAPYGWGPGDPVQVVVHAAKSVDGDKAELPSAFRQMGPVELLGEIHKSLPVTIQRQFAAKGLKIAPTCVVVNLKGLPTVYQASDTGLWIGVGGLAITLIIFGTLALAKVVNAEAAAASS